MSTGLFDRQPPKPQARPLLQFKAGKMTMREDRSVHPDTRKGCAYLYQAPSDYSVHFCWFDRRTGLIEENFVLVPREAEFKPVPQCKTGRVFVLKLKTTPPQLFFIWMQEPNASNDAQICESVNKFINTPPTPLSVSSGSSLTGASSSSRPMGRVSDILRSMHGLTQNDLLTLFNMGFGIPPDGESSLGQGLTIPSLHSAASSSAPTAATVSAAPSSTSGGSSKQPGKLRLEDLHSILSQIQPRDRPAGRRGVDLTQTLNADSVRGVLEADGAAADRLAAHLPPLDPEDDQCDALQSVLGNLRSAQYKSSLKSFTEAFESGQLGPALSQFGLPEEAVATASSGDILAFASALQKSSSSSKTPSDAAGSSGNNEGQEGGADKDGEKKQKEGQSEGAEKMDTD